MDIDSCYLSQISRLSKLLNRHYTTKIQKHHELRSPQVVILMTLADGPLILGDIAKKVGSERTTVGRNVTVLEKKGYISAYRCSGDKKEDRRMKYHDLTQKGKDCLENLEKVWDQTEIEMEKICSNSAFPLQSLRKHVKDLSSLVIQGGRLNEQQAII